LDKITRPKAQHLGSMPALVIFCSRSKGIPFQRVNSREVALAAPEFPQT